MKEDVTRELQKGAVRLVEDIGRTSRTLVAEVVSTLSKSLKTYLQQTWNIKDEELTITKKSKKTSKKKEQ